MIALIFYIFISLAPSASSAIPNTPESCFNQPDFQSFIEACWMKFIRKNASVSDIEYPDILPKGTQRTDWQSVVRQMLDSDGNCEKIQIPKSIQEIAAIKKFEDKVNKDDKFCILYEKTTISTGRFKYGWGLFAVPLYKNWSKLNLHYSAAHPFTDWYVEVQAPVLFQRTRGRSLALPGLTRNASAVDTTCQPLDDRERVPGDINWRTDPSHDNTTMLHSTLIVTKNWQFDPVRNSTCTWSNCAFIQMHGLGKQSCRDAAIFICAGAKKSADKYKEPNLPANKIRQALTQYAPGGAKFASLPEGIKHALEVAEPKAQLVLTSGDGDYKCKNGVTNLFGRLLNKVPPGQECSTKVNPKDMSGFFVHIEQWPEMRVRATLDMWTQAILKSFS